MVIPLGDERTGRDLTPYVVFALIAVNALVWLLQLSLGDTFTNGYATVPFEITHGQDLIGPQTVVVGGQAITIPEAPGPSPIYLTLLTSMFMHGGWMHILGNMLYLWIFGDNVEDRFGSLKFLIFYLVCGIAATLAQYYVSPGSRIPNVGASGAIAGVLGSYLLLFPNARVRVLLYNRIVAMPAIAVLGFWIVLQIFAGAGALFNTAQSQDTGGVAYMAHVGGFVAGFLFTFLLRGWESDPPRAL